MKKEIKVMLRKIPLHSFRLLVEKKIIGNQKEFEDLFKDVDIDQLKKK